MKKKKPTLTHYTKKLKKVRLARTVTVIATLFVSGVVVAANVLPQVIKSNAATSDTSNDVIAGGVNQWYGDTAKSELIQKVYTASDDQALSARALYAKFGVTADKIRAAKFEWLYGPNVTGSKVSPNESITPFGDWNSFGRQNNTAYTLFQVTYGSKTANFYYKAHKIMFPGTWSSGTSAEPVLMSTDRTWFISLKCGNIVVKTIPSNPSINFTKAAVSVTRGTKTYTQAEVNAAGFKLQLKDRIKYRLTGKNGDVVYPAGLRLIDRIPTGTKLVAQGGDGFPNVTVTKVANANVNGDPAVAWDFSAIPANQGGYTDFTVEVTAVTSQICNIGLWGTSAKLLGATNQVCLQVEANKPLLTVTKVAQNAPASVKVGDQVSYKIEMTNTGTADAANAVAVDLLKRVDDKLTQEFVSLGTASVTRIADGSTVSATTHAIKDTASQATYANGNKDVFGYQVDSLPAGTKLSFVITTKAVLLPQACDYALGNYKDSGNPIGVTATAEVCIPVVNPDTPRVKVTKSAVSPAANKQVARGQVITYDIVVENPSKVALPSTVTVKDTFTPAGYAKDITIVGKTSGVTATVVTDGVNITVPKLAAGEKATVRISAKVADTAADNQKFCNNATITTSFDGNISTETSSSVCHTTTLIKKNKTAKYLDRGDDPQKVPADAGDEIEYTLTTRNQASEAVSYVVSEDLSDILSYADVVDNGGGTLTGTNLVWAAKSIPAGGSITNTFKIKVKDPVPNNQPSAGNPGDFDYNMFNSYGDEVNIKINKPLIQKVVDVATNLPETGAAQYGLVIFFLGLSVYFFVRNKQLTNELAVATVEYQHQASTTQMAQAQSLIHPEEDDVTPEPPAPTPPAA